MQEQQTILRHLHCMVGADKVWLRASSASSVTWVTITDTTGRFWLCDILWCECWCLKHWHSRRLCECQFHASLTLTCTVPKRKPNTYSVFCWIVFERWLQHFGFGVYTSSTLSLSFCFTISGLWHERRRSVWYCSFLDHLLWHGLC